MLPIKPSAKLQTHRAAIRRVVEAHRARNPRVFGSVLSGEDTEQSDLDILVDAAPGATLLDIGAIRYELERLLGIPVDVLTPGALPEKFRATVIAQARPI
jgi:predicted nucleotidyltransferase